MGRYLCIHGHFYQPPRENPWLEEIEVQDSAAPFHDWNERINRECYSPNTVSRAHNKAGRISGIRNNFEDISFNIGPTLFSWLETHDRFTYDRIIAADRASQHKYGGHGGAIAQAYNHIIMPLATARDKDTQIKWGIADFHYRFGRKPVGMWLPETGACMETLETLASNGILFTILCQSQAKEVRESWESNLHGTDSGIDPTRPYYVSLKDGKKIAIFFYDGPISRAVAYERLLQSGEKFADRLNSGYSQHRNWEQLLSIATDGETFGHHHRFGEMALTYAIDRFNHSDDVTMTNYAQYLDSHPPDTEVAIHDFSSWSCAHGVDRWRNDCGCKIDVQRGWRQRWRAPLRKALDRLKEDADNLFASEGGLLFTDPWTVRNDYIDVILKRVEPAVFVNERMIGTHTRGRTIEALKLLEMQRNSMLMFTSCGWFFDDISGIETLQILKYAARTIELFESLSHERVEEEFIETLTEAGSNIPEYVHGGSIYRKMVQPDKTPLSKVTANHAIIKALHPENGASPVSTFSVNEVYSVHEGFGENTFSLTKTVTGSTITLEESPFMVATLKLGKSDVTCFVKSISSEVEYTDAVRELVTVWREKPITGVIRTIDDLFKDGGETFWLKDLFIEARRKAVANIVSGHVDRFSETYEKLFHDNRMVMEYFIGSGVPAPKEFHMAAKYTLERELLNTAGEIGTHSGLDRMARLTGDIKRWDLNIDFEPIHTRIEEAICEKITESVSSKDISKIKRVVEALLAVQFAGIKLDLWDLQNRFAEAYFASRKATNDPFLTSSEITKLGIMLNFASD